MTDGVTAQHLKAQGLAQMIPVELDPPQPGEDDPRMVFEVEVTKTMYSTFYVLAHSEADAKLDAEELANECDDWDDKEIDTHVREAQYSLNSNYGVWTGGDDGDWISVVDITVPLTPRKVRPKDPAQIMSQP